MYLKNYSHHKINIFVKKNNTFIKKKKNCYFCADIAIYILIERKNELNKKQ